MELERVCRKISDHVSTPAGVASTIQGVAVYGYAHGDAPQHPVLTYVVR